MKNKRNLWNDHDVATDDDPNHGGQTDDHDDGNDMNDRMSLWNH